MQNMYKIKIPKTRQRKTVKKKKTLMFEIKKEYNDTAKELTMYYYG